MAEGKVLEWTMGFRNVASKKYLTTETFGFALNVGGTSLKKKQIFWLQPGLDGTVNIRSSLGRFLAHVADPKDPTVAKGDAEHPTLDTQWTIEAQADGTWAFKSRQGFYLTGSGEKVSVVNGLTDGGKWVVHLAMHPQVNVKNVLRQRYVHLEDGELHCNEDVPWGVDALLTFVFFEEDGRYGFLASNNKYLTATGRLSDTPVADARFLLGFHDDQISLRDAKGLYLSCLGAKGVLKTNKDKVTKDELFSIQDSEPQFTIQDNRGKLFSNRASEELKADQADVTDHEQFQLELDAAGLGSFKNSQSKYWSVGDGSVIVSNSSTKGPAQKFHIEYKGNQWLFKASNGKYLVAQSNGKIQATGNGTEENAVFVAKLINRPQIVLRGSYGFVGTKGASGRLESSKARGEIFDVEWIESSRQYALRWAGNYWGVDGDGVHVNSKEPLVFNFEFVERSKFLIRLDNGSLLQGDQSGGFKAVQGAANEHNRWEY